LQLFEMELKKRLAILHRRHSVKAAVQIWRGGDWKSEKELWYWKNWSRWESDKQMSSRFC
jgi:hypothetical protein